MTAGVTGGAGPIRVLWVSKGLGAGGAERLLVSLARVHDRRRVRPEAVRLLSWKDALVPELESAGVPVHDLGVRSGADPRWLPGLLRLVRRRRPHVVHFHSPLPAGVARAPLRLLAPHVRMVTTEHTPWWSYAPPTRLLNAATAALDHAHLAVSDDARSSVWPPLRRRVETVAHGLVLDDLARPDDGERARVRAELGVADDEVLVLTVANLRAQKAYPDLLAAARAAIDRGAPIRFAAVGQGPLEAEVAAEHARLDLGDRFRLLGYRADVLRLLGGADLFALSSRWEGLPVALMEALAAGVPAVATAVGGVPGAVRDGVDGRLVPPGRPDLLADALVALATDPAGRAAMAAAARAGAARFDVSRAARRLEALYEGLAGRAAPAPAPSGRPAA